MKRLTLLLLLLTATACKENTTTNSELAKEKTPITTYYLERPTFNRGYHEVFTSTIEGCKFIFWDNSYGSSFNHHPGCENPKHK